MPEGLRFNSKILPSEQVQQPSQSIENITESTPSIADPKMRKDSMIHLSNNGTEMILADRDRKRRGSIRYPSNALSGKKVSFTEERSRARAAGPENQEPSSPTRQVPPAVQKAQSHREVKNPVAVQYKYRTKRSASFRESLRQGESYQVLMLGAVGVGKSSLVQQFQDSHNGHVSIKVSNVYGDNCRRANDAQLTIVDNPAIEITAEMAIACCDADAYVIVYSVTDRESFKTAEQILQAICTQDNYSKKAAILVGNKVDLVRRRIVNTEEGKACATSYGCKFIETSDWIDYNVDELFEGVLAQIRLRLEAPNAKGKKRGYRRSKTLGTKSWGMLKDFINKINRKVKSCDDLHVL